MDTKDKILTLLPSVNHIVGKIAKINEEQIPNELMVSIIREVISEYRIKLKDDVNILSNKEKIENDIIKLVLWKIKNIFSSKIKKVINATGVVIHTNIGRSVYSDESVKRMVNVALNYTNLEYDVDGGTRGSRYNHLEELLCQITSAEGAVVVNNNAAAVFLVLREFAKNREVIVSRGEIIEIGGSFRVSEIMKESDAELIEVGTSNKTRLSDYEKAINNNTALMLKVHKSNFYTVGFTESVHRRQLVELGKSYSIPIYEDLGSGTLIDFDENISKVEPSVKTVVKDGVDLVSFSGDKLMGGPQAGIIVGKRRYIEQLKKSQLIRALRVDKLTIACLEATLQHYLIPEEAKAKIPTIRDIVTSIDVINHKAEKVLEKIIGNEYTDIKLEPTTSLIGGGSLPGVELPSISLQIKSSKYPINKIESKLRECEPPVISRIKDNKLILDLRTVKWNELSILAHCISNSIR